ncbi:MAG: four helix bundle protein [Candidatus Neomarinimicrobiota bacterium]
MTKTIKNSLDFTALDCWKKCREVKLLFYNEILPILPEEEKYNLSSQIRRASIGITSNIAEGYGRYHYQESIQYYRISRGSLYELKDHLISCIDLNYIPKDLFDRMVAHLEEAIKLVNGFIRYIGKKKESSNEQA